MQVSNRKVSISLSSIRKMKDVVTQLATVEELTYSMIANADESEHANLVQKLTNFCIESD